MGIRLSDNVKDMLTTATAAISMQKLFRKLWDLGSKGIPDKDRRFASNKDKRFASIKYLICSHLLVPHSLVSNSNKGIAVTQWSSP
jgi:hypothetical protein